MADFNSQYQNPYDYLRQKAKEQSQQQAQQEDDALKRRFAAQGTLNSGAYLKTQENQDELHARQAADAQNQIGFQEAQEKSARQYQTSEREASQLFQKSLVDSDQAFKAKYADLDNAFREKEFGLNQQISGLNAAIAAKNAGMSPYEVLNYQQNLAKAGFNFGAAPSQSAAPSTQDQYQALRESVAKAPNSPIFMEALNRGISQGLPPDQIRDLINQMSREIPGIGNYIGPSGRGEFFQI